MRQTQPREETFIAKIIRLCSYIEKDNVEGLEAAIAQEGITFFSQPLPPLNSSLMFIAVQHNHLPTIELLMKYDVSVQGVGNGLNLLECALFTGLYKGSLSHADYTAFITRLLDKGLRVDSEKEDNASLLCVLQAQYHSIYVLLQDYNKYDEQQQLQQVKQQQGGGWFPYLSSFFGLKSTPSPYVDMPLQQLPPARYSKPTF